jgi:hypothetical protein
VDIFHLVDLHSALAALAGAVIGELTSVLASWLSQHAQAKARWLTQDKLLRPVLYKEFIEAALNLREFGEACRSEFESLRSLF